MKNELTDKQKAFVAAYSGNVEEAAKAAGLSADYARFMIGKPHIAAAIRERQREELKPHILTREQRQKLWSEVSTDASVAMRDRLRASELLAKSEGDFIERRDITVKGAGGLLADLMAHVQKHEADAAGDTASAEDVI